MDRCACRVPWTLPCDPILWVLFLGALTLTGPAAGLEPAHRNPRLDTLVDQAREHYSDAASAEPGFVVQTQAESAEGTTCKGQFSVLGGATRTETWFEGLFSDFGFVTVSDGPRSGLWRVSGHIVERGEPWVTTGSEFLYRWFDHPAVSHGHASLGPDEVVGGRTCRVIRLETVPVDGWPSYRFDGGRARDVADFVVGAALEVTQVQVMRDGAPVTLPPADWVEVVASDNDAEVTILRAVDANQLPVIAGRSPRGRVSPTLDVRRLVDVVTELWVDAEGHQLVKLEGLRLDPSGGEPSTVVVTLSEFLDRGWAWPTEVEVTVDGAMAAQVTASGLEEGGVTPAMFEPTAVTTELEIGVQEANEEEIRRLMTDDTFKHGGLDPARDIVFKPDLLVDTLELEDGDVVADIGAGTGYFTFRLAHAVGPSGWVYAVDVNAAVLDALVARIYGEGDEASRGGKNSARDDLNILDIRDSEAEEKPEELCPHRNVVIHVNEFEDLSLAANSLDLAFLCASGLSRYRHLSPTNAAMMESIYRATRSGGEFVVIERQPQGRDMTVQLLGLSAVPLGHPGTPDAPAGVADSYPFGLDEIIRANGRAAGFDVVRSVDLIEAHAFVVFRKPAK